MMYELSIKKRKIIVSAAIKGISESRDFNFILDTGATKTVIDNGLAVALGYDLKKLKTGDKLMTAGGSILSKILHLPKFSLFGKDIDNFEVNALKFPPQITLLADGLIGMDFLLKFKNVNINFEEKTISVI